MPRREKGVRLHWRHRKDGPSVWEIRDGNSRISTGTDDRIQAEKSLSDYLTLKARPAGPTGPQELAVSMCLTIYGEEHAAHVAAPERIGYAIEALDRFWADQPVAAITGATCRKYAKDRITRYGKPAAPGTIRRELNVLQAALNYCHAEGYLTSAPRVTLPVKPPARQRWLTRQEVSWLLRGARALRKDGKHLQDFILCGIYTGSRKATILALHINTPSLAGGHVDTITGILYRKPAGKTETTKRQQPARLPARYLAYLRIRAASGRNFVVQGYHGNRVADIKHGWSGAVAKAQELAALKGISLDLTGVTPHTLKHTAITWSLQRGASIWDAAGYFSTSSETIERVYGHHSPDHQKTAVLAMDKRI